MRGSERPECGRDFVAHVAHQHGPWAFRFALLRSEPDMLQSRADIGDQRFEDAGFPGCKYSVDP
jgi:hypothetical protein